MSKKRKTWYSNLPWGRRLHIEDSAKEKREQQERNHGDPAIYVNFTAIWRALNKWRNRRNPNRDE